MKDIKRAKLTLRKETLRDLRTADIQKVAGGFSGWCDSFRTSPTSCAPGCTGIPL
jgi:hypothetical protein